MKPYIYNIVISIVLVGGLLALIGMIIVSRTSFPVILEIGYANAVVTMVIIVHILISIKWVKKDALEPVQNQTRV